MDGERSRASITKVVNFVLGLGITWTMAIIALLCLLMHTLFSLLHKYGHENEASNGVNVG